MPHNKETRVIGSEYSEMPDDVLPVLKDGKEGRFWQVVKHFLKNNIRYQKDQVVLNDNLSSEEREHYRRMAKANTDLLKLPERIIQNLEGGEAPEPENHDPYYQDYAQIGKDQNKTN